MENLTFVEQEIITLAKHGVLGEKAPLPAFSTEEEKNSFFRILKEQNLMSFLFPVTGDKAYKKYYLSSYLYHEKINNVGEQIEKFFSENNIRILFFKGYLVQHLYPETALRSFGDLDFVVDSSDYKKANQLMKDQGFNFISKCDHHAEFRKNGMEFECHCKMMPKSELGFFLFSHPFSKAVKRNEYSYCLDDTTHFLFVLLHYLKHLKSGAGIRGILDLYLMMRKTEIDYQTVRKELEKLKLTKFFETILSEIKIVFDYEPFSFAFNPASYKLISYSLKSGVHGYGKTNDLVSNQTSASHKSKFGFLLSKIFIPLDDLRSLYPFTKCFLLIPLGYICRFFHLLFNSSKKIKDVIESDNDDSFFKEIGI